MRPLIAAVAALGAFALLAAASTADAQPRKRSTAKRVDGASQTVFVSRDETGRTRTRIIVQRRSYLDAGTEVLPGQRKYHDYHTQPFWSPIDILGPGRNYDRMPLNSRWEFGAPRY